MSCLKTDFLIVGAGIVGLNLAISLKSKYPDATIMIIEKEKQPAFHASGRNTGVLHAGFYYTPDSVKAKFCREGNKHLTNYCLERSLPINQCGKLVVTKDNRDLKVLDELIKRGKENHVELIELDDNDVKDIEPNVYTYQKALFSPNTSTVDPRKIINALINDLIDQKIELKTDTAFIARKGNLILSSKGYIETGYLVNAAGLYADKIAMMYGFSENYRILPFKGIYLHADDKVFNLNTNVYPVPNLENPFLGVHYTLDVSGKIKIGPTAIPAFWREQYSGLENFIFSEFIEIFLREVGLFLFNHFDFRKLAFEELKKYSKKSIVNEAKKMVPSLSSKKVSEWGKPGIRAQLINLIERKLEMDFIFEGDNQSFHVLNAVSPAFTCSKPLADFLVEKISENLS